MTNWTNKKFSDLTPEELYAILRLRSEVFVVEQNCVFLDMDNKDQLSHHLMGWQEDRLVAYARIVPPGISYAEFSIGRIVSSPAVRKQGIGRVLVSKGIELALRGPIDKANDLGTTKSGRCNIALRPCCWRWCCRRWCSL